MSTSASNSVRQPPLRPDYPIEDPKRLQMFGTAVGALDWTGSQSFVALDTLITTLTDLGRSEVAYYWRGRKRARRVSLWFRIFAWVSGTVGVLLPLVAGAQAKPDTQLAPAGFAFLAAAGAFLAANTLFGGSRAHARCIVAQLELERLITTLHVGWHRIRAVARDNLSDEQLREGFALAVAFVGDVHKVLQEETTSWRSDLDAAVNRYATTVRPPQQP